MCSQTLQLLKPPKCAICYKLWSWFSVCSFRHTCLPKQGKKSLPIGWIDGWGIRWPSSVQDTRLRQLCALLSQSVNVVCVCLHPPVTRPNYGVIVTSSQRNFNSWNTFEWHRENKMHKPYTMTAPENPWKEMLLEQPMKNYGEAKCVPTI